MGGEGDEFVVWEEVSVLPGAWRGGVMGCLLFIWGGGVCFSSGGLRCIWFDGLSVCLLLGGVLLACRCSCACFHTPGIGVEKKIVDGFGLVCFMVAAAWLGVSCGSSGVFGREQVDPMGVLSQCCY